MTANQISVTEGSGKNVATETIGSTDYQQIKIIDGKVGSSSVLSFVNNGTAIPVSVMGSISITGIPSISGTVNIAGTPSISGTVNIAGNPSVSGQVNVGSVFGAITPYAQSDSFVFGSPSVMTTTSSVLVLAAPSGTLRNYASHILATNAGAVATIINIIDNGQVIYSGYAAASGGGYSATLPVPLRQPTSALGLFAATTATTSVLVSITGFKAN